MRLDAAQAALLLADGLLELCPTQSQHPVELLERELVDQQIADLLEREPEVAQRQQPMQATELPDAVVAAAAPGVDPLGNEQFELVVVTQHSRGHPPEPGELSDAQRDETVIRLDTV